MFFDRSIHGEKKLCLNCGKSPDHISSRLGLVFLLEVENGQIFIQNQYDQFLSQGIALNNIKVLQIQEHQPPPSMGNLYPQNVTLIIQGTRTEI